MDTFTTYGGPANRLVAANTLGLPVNKRPRTAIRLHSSN